MQKNLRSVEEYLQAKSDWTEGLVVLREELLACGLEETIKWGAPCYTHAGRNVVSLAAFKNDFCLWFHEGGSLRDPEGLLQSAKGSKSASMRQWRFTEAKQIKKRILRRYLREAMNLAELPKPAKRAAAPKLVLPEEFAQALRDPKLRAAFEALTPGRQREYAEHIAEAKREATKQSRLAKITPMILAGSGLNDRYRC